MTNSKKGYGGAGNCVIVHSYFNKVVKEISVLHAPQDDLQKLKTVLREKRAQLIFIINPNKSTDR